MIAAKMTDSDPSNTKNVQCRDRCPTGVEPEDVDGLEELLDSEGEGEGADHLSQAEIHAEGLTGLIGAAAKPFQS